MGRYYDTSTGRNGKFMFAVQNSDDPEYMGMGEDPTYIHYYADESDVDKITKRLNEQYEILGIGKDNRLYDMPRKEDGTDNHEAYDKWETKYLHDKVWRAEKFDGLNDEDKKKMHWASDKGDEYVGVEIGEGKCLALARIRLAIKILSDIKDEGYCSLDAEL